MAPNRLFATVFAAALTIAPSFALEPAEIIANLYAERPSTDYPPGGYEVWSPGLSESWSGHSQYLLIAPLEKVDRAYKTATADFLAGGQLEITDVKLAAPITIGDTMKITVTVEGSPKPPATLLYEFLRTDDQWGIDQVTLQGQDGWLLTDRLLATY